MTAFAGRRIRYGSITAAVLALVAAWVWLAENSLGRSAFATGYLLLAAILFLAGYNLRKRLPQLPLGSAATWLQLHLYVGVGSVALLLLHVGPHWPRGVLDTTLATVYGLTVASGVIGIYITRTIPAQLARVGREVVYERIPALRRQVAGEAHELVLQTVSAYGSTTLADFYVDKLYRYFECPRELGYRLRPTARLRHKLMAEMRDLGRYLSDDERQACERLFALVRQKDDLDFHQARQGLLKGWLFVHIALGYSLVVLAVLHALAAHVYWGGAL